MDERYKQYKSGVHRSNKTGYLSPEIVESSAVHMADLVRKYAKSSIMLLVVDGSSCILAAATALELAKDRYVSIRTPDGYGDGVKWHTGSLDPPDHPLWKDETLVFVDDYLCSGRSLQTAHRWAGRGVDLAIYIQAGPCKGAVPHWKLQPKHMYSLFHRTSEGFIDHMELNPCIQP